MKQIVHFNGKFWLNEDGKEGVEIVHKEALGLVQNGQAVYVKGGSPNAKRIDEAA